jgi:hypothetical protein
MIAADLTSAEERELLEKYNIVLLRYSNSDGCHSQLRRHLSTIDRFIISRLQRSDKSPAPERSVDKIKAATSLFLFRRLQAAKSNDYSSHLF